VTGPQSRRFVLVPLFFATGAAGFGYQVLWAKQFSASVGHEFPAVLAIITAFLGGIATGAWLYGKLPILHTNNCTYGVLEIGIGIWGIVIALAGTNLARASIALLGPAPPAILHWVFVFSVIGLLLLPATAAMGATFPAIEKLLRSAPESRNVGLLYSANTAGSVIGALSAAFWLMPSFGIPNSILGLASLNILCGIVAISIASGRTRLKERSARAERALTVRLLATGFLGLAFETVMIRGLTQVLENTVFTFAIVLAIYLLATALGGALQQRFRFQTALPALFATIAFVCALGGLTLRILPGIYERRWVAADRAR
jgi:spermidine synthase